ncbi:MAG: hypothetical protein V2A73_17490 [Pseudomonadota bacterium]
MASIGTMHNTAALLRLLVPVILACLPAALSLSCGHSEDPAFLVTFDPCQPLSVVASPETAVEERLSVADALAMWNDTAKTSLVDEELPDANVIPVFFQDAAPAFYGLYDDQHGTIFINRRLQDRRPRSITIAHELGHAFGLFHVAKDDRLSVMNNGNLDILPTDDDVQALAEIWGACRPVTVPLHAQLDRGTLRSILRTIDIAPPRRARRAVGRLSVRPRAESAARLAILLLPHSVIPPRACMRRPTPSQKPSSTLADARRSRFSMGAGAGVASHDSAEYRPHNVFGR